MENKLSSKSWTEEEIKDILQFSHDKVASVIDKCALRGKRDVASLLNGLFSGSPAPELVMHLFKYCIALFMKPELPTKVASQIVGVLMMQVDDLSTSSQVELVSEFNNMVKQGSVTNARRLELLPKVLSSISVKDNVSFDGRSMTGAQYKSHILNSICSCRWAPDNVIHLAATFRDITLTSDELGFVVDKVIRSFKDLDYQELPPLIYQLLLLSTKGHKRTIIDGMCCYFNKRDEECKSGNSDDDTGADLMELTDEGRSFEQLRHTEGTVILHMTFAVKQDQDLGREFIKYLKNLLLCNPGQVLTAFNFALALSIGKIHRFEEQISDLLKTVALKCFKDCQKQMESAWVSEMVPAQLAISEGPIQTVENSKFGWDQVIQGLVQFGFTLLDSFGPKASFGKITEEVIPSTQLSANQQACQLGSKILLETFKVHDSVRSEIIDQILNRVVTKTSSPVSHYLDLLGKTVLSVPQTLLDSVPRIRQAFDYLSFLPPLTSENLLKAVQPLMKISSSLKDSLLLVLRKAMFSRQLDSRKVAVNGFLLILKQFRVLGGLPLSQASQSISSSQIIVDIHSKHNPHSNEALCLEILGNLRRCLTQQADVRLILYEGLYEIVSRNSKLCSPVLDLLLSQFRKYYEANVDVNPPVNLENCITAQGEDVYLTEPLAHLVGCIQQCVIIGAELRTDQSEDMDDDRSSLSELEEMLASLTRRMVKSEMEDFELDKSAEYSMSKSVGVRNNIFAILVCGLYEVLIEYNLAIGQLELECCEQILKLYKNYHILAEILREKSTAGKKGKSPSNKLARSLMSFKCAASLLDSLFSDMVPANQGSLGVLRDEAGLVQYMVLVNVQKLQQINDRGSCDGIEGKHAVKIFKHICTVTRIFLQFYGDGSHHLGNAGKRQLTTACLEGLVLALSIVSTRYTQDHFTEDFLLALDPHSDSMDTNVKDIVYLNIKKFQRLVVAALTSDNDDHKLKDVGSLLTCIGLLSRLLPPGCEELGLLNDWLTRLATERVIEDASVSKSLLLLLFEITSKVKDVTSLLQNISQDLHSQLGDIDQEVEVEDRTHFAMVTAGSGAASIFTQVLLQMDKELDSIDWVLNRMKAEQGSAISDISTQQQSQKGNRERSLCNRLGIIVTSFYELTQTAVPAGPCTENLLKALIKLYSTLAAVVKFYISLYGQSRGQISTRFEKLVKMSSTHLTQPVYALITYIQASQNEKLSAAVTDKKKDAKKQGIVGEHGKARILKETKSIPNLVFAIEQYERYLIQLSKKSKVNLMEHMKLSTSRDFRINVASVQAALNDSSDDGDEDDDQENSGSDKERTPPSKKGKLAVNSKEKSTS